MSEGNIREESQEMSGTFRENAVRLPAKEEGRHGNIRRKRDGTPLW